MDMGSVHATFLADALVDWLGGRAAEGEALGRYRKLRDDHALEPFEETVTFARDLSKLGAEHTHSQPDAGESRPRVSPPPPSRPRAPLPP